VLVNRYQLRTIMRTATKVSGIILLNPVIPVLVFG